MAREKTRKADSFIKPEDYTFMNDAVFTVAASGVGERFILDTVVLFIGKLEISKMRSHLTVENGLKYYSPIFDAIVECDENKLLRVEVQNRNTIQKGVIFFTLPISFPALFKKLIPTRKCPTPFCLSFASTILMAWENRHMSFNY